PVWFGPALVLPPLPPLPVVVVSTKTLPPQAPMPTAPLVTSTGAMNACAHMSTSVRRAALDRLVVGDAIAARLAPLDGALASVLLGAGDAAAGRVGGLVEACVRAHPDVAHVLPHGRRAGHAHALALARREARLTEDAEEQLVEDGRPHGVVDG